ncbi:hypothetical protein GCM10007973_18180 [Polymorphobacter multimanifer]|uniref:Uncharacterized protein n=1 Tax=Polymorphobacter multimanifer TaxID=1070431 RepID=A0A841LBI2_9SPHN|nr:hypothetical protein [Polymorphobacter multimanifer]MBB6228333.1 hypothetical protein [Polymorphobacter multimanifer]GGI82104.1 hypothetical protein GCM10007973_18180 [Polymorphobacter multimanifer]
MTGQNPDIDAEIATLVAANRTGPEYMPIEDAVIARAFADATLKVHERRLGNGFAQDVQREIAAQAARWAESDSTMERDDAAVITSALDSGQIG